MNTEDILEQRFRESYEKGKKDAFLQGVIVGFEVSNTMLLDYSKRHTKKELEAFMLKNIKNKEAMGKAIGEKIESKTN